MLHTCDQRFDVTGNLENFWELNKASHAQLVLLLIFACSGLFISQTPPQVRSVEVHHGCWICNTRHSPTMDLWRESWSLITSLIILIYLYPIELLPVREESPNSLRNQRTIWRHQVLRLTNIQKGATTQSYCLHLGHTKKKRGDGYKGTSNTKIF